MMNLVKLLDSWQPRSHPFVKLGFGKWELKIPSNPDGSCHIWHGSKIKVATQ